MSLPSPLDFPWLLRAVARSVEQKLTALRPAERRWRREKDAQDLRFDLANGVETRGIVTAHELAGPAGQRRSAVTYIAVEPDEFARCFARLDIDYQRFTFVDLGSGKGRPLLLASHFPFKQIVGVELSRRLHDVAQDNVRRYHDPAQRSRNFQLACADAADFVFPDGPLVVFLYNPFGPEVMAQVAASLRASFLAAPRQVRVLYADPLHLEVWTAGGFQCLDRGNRYAILTPA
jgi:SAM-dependent methyltransferase